MKTMGEQARPRIGEGVYIAPTAYVGGDVVIDSVVQSYMLLGREYSDGRFPNIVCS